MSGTAPKRRLDHLLVVRGAAPTGARAQALILAGKVRVAGTPVTKAGTLVRETDDITIDVPDHPYVSRGGVKLAAALDALGIDPAGYVCVDVGAGTGGFTDCLLQRGAVKVYTFDVGTNQLDWRLRSDPRVVAAEGVNARRLDVTAVADAVDLIVVDVSFISLKLVLPALKPLVGRRTRLLPMVKPQFEAGRGAVDADGVVRDETVRRAAIDGIRAFGRDVCAWNDVGEADAGLPGPRGNRETFVLFVPRTEAAP